MKHRPPTRRRPLEWVLLAACLLLMIAWHISLAWHLGAGFNDRRISISGGQLLFWNLHTLNTTFHGWHLICEIPTSHSIAGDKWVDTVALSDGGTTITIIPLWMLLTTISIPTIILFRRDHQRPPGHCQHCGYNLTGNESGQCPECGGTVEE